MLILIEGQDCAGKSTFVEHLADRIRRTEPTTSVTVLHSGAPRDHPLDEYVGRLLDYRPELGQHIICDRWHLGEVVYPRVLNRPTQQTAAVRAYVELFLRSRGALLVYCAADGDYLRDCADARDDDGYGASSRVDVTRDAFDRAVVTSLLPQVVCDVTDLDRAIGEGVDVDVLGLANDEAWYAERLNPFTTYVGPPEPGLLLFGDRRGPSDTDLADYRNLPAFVPHTGTSGRYLFDVLTRWPLRVAQHGITLNQLGIANACDVDDPRALWEALGRPPTVALGINAHNALRTARVDYRRVPHPQYVRRFHHNEFENYLHQLLKIGVHA